MSEQITVTHERTDAIPVILALLQQMRVAEVIAKHFPPHGHGTGLRLGQMLSVWLTFILSEGDHRLSPVEPWIAAHQQTLSRCVHQQVWPRDGADDRLARGRDAVGVVAPWVAGAGALHQTLIRVYDLPPKTVRVDPTTVSAYVTPDGLCQLGHSKAYRPDLPQLKSALSTRAPRGLPMTITTVAGTTADAPLYRPEIAKVRQSVGQTGMTYSGDGNRAAWATRAAIVAHRDFSLCPLAAQQVSVAELERRLAPLWKGQQPLEDVRLTDESDAEDDEAPDAVGFAYTSAQDGRDQAGHAWHWQEQRWVVRSLAHARLQEETVRQRALRATEEIKARNERQQGKKRLTDEAATRQAAEVIVAKPHVAEVVRIAVPTTVHAATQRRYGQRPAQTIRITRVRVEATRALVRMAQGVRRLGGRVYATNHDRETMGLQPVVAAYRSAYLVAQGMRRFKGRALSLPPLSWRDEHRIVGVIFLLSIALRVLILRQFVVRKHLKQEGATLQGIYPGQPGRHTPLPTTEMMLGAFRGIT